MAVKGPSPLPFTLVAGADLSLAQNCPVGLDATGKVVVANAPSDFIGVLQNKPRLGEHATVDFAPAILPVKVGLAVAAGNYLTIQSLGGCNVIPGNKSVWNVNSWVNAGSKTSLIGRALETVSSGGIATIYAFPATMINSN